MKQMLITLLFLTGVAPLVLSMERKFYLIQQNETWSTARTYCRANYTDLATIKSDDDMVKLQTEAQMNQFTSDAWFGLSRQTHGWRWSYKNETLRNWTNWNTGEYLGANKEECVVMYYNGVWGDRLCTEPLNFLCYDEKTSRYIYITSPKTWFKAQSYCRLHHTDLVSIKNATENSILHGMIYIRSWIGLYKTTWKWSDQTNMDYITWMAGQPDNNIGIENCGYLSNFQAADEQCSNTKPFFCLKVLPDRNQILNLKVQSDQVMNDPAVQATLLEKIRQKLKEHGMEQNITLRWRERPGGEVFHKIEDANDPVG